jgi:DNA mismatch repair protein MutS
MTALAGKLSGVEHATVAVREHDGDVIFLHEVIRGAADRSYGVQVARLAGLPDSVVARAREVLNALEKGEREGGAKPAAIIDDLPLFAAAAPRETPKSEPIPPQYAEVAKLLDTTHPDELSPREALDLLYKLKEASRQ